MPPVEPPNFLSSHGLPAHRAGKALTDKLGLVYGRDASHSKHNDAAEPGTAEPRPFALYLPLLLQGSLPLLREYHAGAAACASAMIRWNAMTGARSENCTIGQLRDCGVK